MLFPSPILLVPHVDVTMAVAWVLLHSMHCTYVFKRCPNGFRYIGITLDSITAMPVFDQTKQNTLYQSLENLKKNLVLKLGRKIQ